MSVFVISDVETRDPGAMARYRVLAAESIAGHGGRYVVRGGRVETLEGGWTPHAIVVIEFDTADQARAWYASPEYAEALALSATALARRLILVEGV
ncbi:MAG TPA: DUF1330 domain-containing protein [Caulobacteraceae bacterium]